MQYRTCARHAVCPCQCWGAKRRKPMGSQEQGGRNGSIVHGEEGGRERSGEGEREERRGADPIIPLLRVGERAMNLFMPTATMHDAAVALSAAPKQPQPTCQDLKEGAAAAKTVMFWAIPEGCSFQCCAIHTFAVKSEGELGPDVGFRKHLVGDVRGRVAVGVVDDRVESLRRHVSPAHHTETESAQEDRPGWSIGRKSQPRSTCRKPSSRLWPRSCVSAGHRKVNAVGKMLPVMIRFPGTWQQHTLD
eukprot:3028712-Rhodomonas_salina.1